MVQNPGSTCFSAADHLDRISFVLAPWFNFTQRELITFTISTVMLIYAVGIGVGVFLVIAVLRVVFRRRLSTILMLFYMLLFSVALLLAVNEKLDMLPMAFDSGGVTKAIHKES